MQSGDRGHLRPDHRGLSVGRLLVGVCFVAFGCGGDGGSVGDSPPRSDPGSVRHWNRIAIDASGLDHTPVHPGENRVAREQLGPGRASRAMAIVHVAMFEAVNAITGGFESSVSVPRAPRDASVEAAVGQAAHDTLVALFRSQAETIDGELADFLATEGGPGSKEEGVAVGARAAAAVLADRADDGSDPPEPVVGEDYTPKLEIGKWRPDPISQVPIALGARWGEVRPFALSSPAQFRVPAPPALTSSEYAKAFAEVKRLGGDGSSTPTERNADQTVAGIFWAYDGTPSLCAPPRLYNQLAVQLADERDPDAIALARLLAQVNVAMADAGIAIWESKYFHEFWRPVAGIREADSGTGPTGLGDGNPATLGDPSFAPLGAPSSNTAGPNFTPPFPAYPSGHAGFGGAVFEVLRAYLGTDQVSFAFVSDEFDGETVGSDGQVRLLIPRFFHSLSEAEEENGQSRIYLGIHWSFDKTAGIAQGRQVADQVLSTLFLPTP